MAFFPEDIMFNNILTRLPAKSLLRLKCVSKKWYNLIDSPHFINLHHKRTLEFPTSDDMILVVPGYQDVRLYTNFDGVTKPTDNGTLLKEGLAVVVGCCNGLICLELKLGYFALCDPLNKSGDCKLIPPLGKMSFDESHEYGFGYDSTSHVYKIVNILTSRLDKAQGRVSEVNIFSTGTGTWEVAEGDFPMHTSPFHLGVSTNNKLHWILKNHDDGYIFTLDLHTQVFGKISTPESNDFSWRGCDLMVSSELLYLYTPIGKEDAIAQIWVMKEYGVAESWTKLHNFTHNNFPYRAIHTSVLAFKPQDNGSGQVLLAGYGHSHEPIWYNLQDKTIKKVEVPQIRGTRHTKPWVCVTTLVSTTHLQTITLSKSLDHRESGMTKLFEPRTLNLKIDSESEIGKRRIKALQPANKLSKIISNFAIRVV